MFVLEQVVMEGTALLGTLCGVLAVLGLHHALVTSPASDLLYNLAQPILFLRFVLMVCFAEQVFLTAFICYLSLFLVGQTFLGFQWDIFLLETGASLVLYAPWGGMSARGPNPAVAWLMRAQWVRASFTSAGFLMHT